MFAPTSTHFSGQVTATVDTIDTVTTVDTINEVANVTSVDTVDAVTNVNLVQTVDNVNNVASVDNVDAVQTVGTCINVTGVSEVDNIVNVQRIQEVPVETVGLFRGDYFQQTPKHLYGHTLTINSNNNFGVISDYDPTFIDPLISSIGVQCAICHYNDGTIDTTSIIKISYYADGTTNSISTQTATLNGVNKVTLTGTIYRIVDIELDVSSPTPPDNIRVFVFDNALTPSVTGVPSTYFDTILIGPTDNPVLLYTESLNTRSTAIYYNPPAYRSIIKSLSFSCTNQTNECGIKIRLYQSNEKFKEYAMYLGPGYTCCKDLYLEMPAKSTLVLYAARLNGTDQFQISCFLDIIQYNP